jgi:hypothetical protein
MTTFNELIQTKGFLEQEAAKGMEYAQMKLDEVKAEIKKMKEEAAATIIEVFYEKEYKWSVKVEGEEESRETNVNKKEAMEIAREVKKEIKDAKIKEQKLNKKEKAANIKHLHQTTETFNEFHRHQ